MIQQQQRFGQAARIIEGLAKQMDRYLRAADELPAGSPQADFFRQCHQYLAADFALLVSKRDSRLAPEGV